ncbi:DUF3618 domain-containing protein [Arthrobacter roseus]|uniref:DUF3618 domain-containing protein n=1 Tax=Arthrobacter roseus TaxID=136274 RepID=UPI001966BD57|nr:DUF3618 domain-containing protein [Arthrobacter roseus]MBM7849735.1 gas vesicle protein [Arthrobacter roseus]
MSQSPDEIRSNIEQTRGRLGTDVDAVADKVSPSNVVHRQTDKVKSKLHDAKDAVMGSGHGGGRSAPGNSHQMGDRLHDAPDTVAQKTKGSPLAAGLIAFGAGLLVSSLIPPSQVESRLADEVKEKAQPLVDEAKDSAKQVAEDMKEPAREAVQDVKDSAQQSAENVKSEGQHAADDVKGRAQEGKDNMRDRSDR